MFSRTQNREERAPLGDALTFHQREPEESHKESTRGINVLTCPGLLPRHLIAGPAGSQEAKEPFDGVQTGPPPRTGRTIRKNESGGTGKKEGSWTQHWPASRREHSEGGQEARGRGSAYEQDLHLPQYSPGKWRTWGLRSCKRSSRSGVSKLLSDHQQH